MEKEEETLRIDLWLWRARFFKSRALAARFIEAGGVRRNDSRLDKPSRTVRVGDALVFAVGGRLIAISVQALGDRRGPASEARALYSELQNS